MRHAVVLVCTLVAGCIEAELVACENGTACPAGFACDEAHRACVTPDRLTACESRRDGTPCLEAGACHHGVCVDIACGNWLVDPLEQCDDGNTLGGDGCSADCTSTERCGNGVIDAAFGEQCDDGALANHDGCDSQCTREQLLATPLAQTATLAVEAPAFAYDDARGMLVVFGGLDATGERTDATVEFTGRTFRVHAPRIVPTARYAASAAYSAAAHAVVMFGGSDLAGRRADTWSWDGEAWTLHTPTVSPPRRSHAAMTYDALRDRVLLFGGRGDAGPLADLWAWDGTTWTELTPLQSPPAREQAQLAYDPVRDRVVLFGSDMWIFDGATWSPHTALLPPPRTGGVLTFAADLGGLLLVGNGPTLLWDGAEWIASGGGSPMFTNRSALVAYYAVAFGTSIAGLGAIASTPQSDVFALVGNAWQPVVTEPGPPLLQDAAMAYAARRGQLVMFGGVTTTNQATTWLHDGNAWTAPAVAEPPPARRNMGMAYDDARDRVVMWGGSSSDTTVYEWDGAAWLRISASGPAPRERTELVYDPVSASTLMFGGSTDTARFADTWQWTGTAWRELSPGPAARSQHGLAYHRASGRVVLFGGIDSAGQRLGDTWTWTAQGGWREENPLASPSPRVRFSLVADPVLGDVVLLGGTLGGEAQRDVWRWDGSTWTREFVDVPSTLADGAAAYDSSRRQIVFHGPAGAVRVQLRGRAADDACGPAIDRDRDGLRGCADPDCAGYCTPLCSAGSCTVTCGDGTCDPLETCRLCPGDCGACEPRCGDGYCDGSETCAAECAP